MPRLRQEGAQVHRSVLIRGTRGERIVIVEHAEVGAGLSPEVVGLGRMNMQIVPARCSQHIVV